ncbi:hypothetical protein [Calothrix sp. 336/3]|nr:hypothetical protein [Calothrix sp. 336/3]
MTSLDYLSGKHHKTDGKNLIHQAFAMHTGGNSWVFTVADFQGKP